MAESIFTSQTPQFPDESDGPYTLGTVFKASVAGRITAIRWYFPATTPGSTVVGLLYRESTGALLGSANFSATPTAGTWNVATLAGPVDIDADTNYVAAVLTPDRYVATGGLFNGVAISNGHLTAPADDPGLRNGRFNIGGTATYPSGSFGANGYLVDVVFEFGTEVAIGLASTTDTAQPVTAAKAVTLARVTATDTAQPVAAAKTRTVGLAAGTDTANVVAVGKTAAVGLATSSSSAFPVTVGKTRPLATAVETSTGAALTVGKTAAIGQATATSTADTLTPVKGRLVGQASTTDTARPLESAIVAQVGTATETDTAFAVAATGGAVAVPGRGRVRLRSYSTGVTLR